MIAWDPAEDLLDVRVHQAAGVISVQVGCDCDAALELLIVEAAKRGQTLHYASLDVIDHVLRFDQPC